MVDGGGTNPHRADDFLKIRDGETRFDVADNLPPVIRFPVRDSCMAHHQHSLRSVTVVSICSFVQLIVQFAFQLLLAKYFGASADKDVYLAALCLPTVASVILVGSLGFAFVPVFLDRRENVGHDAAWQMASNFGLLLLLTATLLSLLGSWFALPLMTVLPPGYEVVQQEKTADLFRILCWLIPLNSLISFQQALYHSMQKFIVPAIATIAGPLVTVLYTMMFYESSGISCVATAVILGAIVTMGVQSPLILRHISFRLGIDIGTKKCLSLLWPLMLGGAYSNLGPLVDLNLASSMPTGSFSHLGYAWRIANALLLLTAGALGTVVFPTLAVHSAADRDSEFRSEIAHAFRFLCFLTVPIVTGVLCFSQAAVRDLFQRGVFTAQDTQAVAMLLVIYLGVIVGGSFGNITSKVFYAQGDTRTPVLTGVVGFTVGLVLKIVLAPSYGVVALAAATTVSYLISIGLMLGLMSSKVGRGVFADVPRSLIRYTLGSAVGAAAGFAVLQAQFRFGSIAALACAVGVYALLLLWLRDEFAVKVWGYLSAKWT